MISDILRATETIDYGGSLVDAIRGNLPTGFRSWDRACDETGGMGLGNWWYVVVAGASNAGKTQLMLHLARQASEHGLRPGIITMEVPKRGLQRRVYSNVTSFGYYDFLPHRWMDGDPVAKTKRLQTEVEAYSQQNGDMRSMLVVEHERAPTLDDIMAACEALRADGSGVIFLDHLQLIKAPADQIADRATEISEALRWFAHQNKVLVVALSQLNRYASRERDRRPTMHDLWGGTAIESNANQVILVDHSKQARNANEKHILRTWLYLDKNREGPNRVPIPVEANFKTGIWREADPHEEALWPE